MCHSVHVVIQLSQAWWRIFSSESWIIISPDNDAKDRKLCWKHIFCTEIFQIVIYKRCVLGLDVTGVKCKISCI